MLPLIIPMYYTQNTILTPSRLNQIKLLIQYGADVNKIDGNGFSPIEYARTLRYEASTPIIRVLMAAGAEVPMTEGFFREFVHMNDLDQVKKFLDLGMDPDLGEFDYQDEETTALTWSVMEGFDEMCVLLIKYGADVNVETSQKQRTPLLMAVMNADLSIVRLLLDNGAKATDAVRGYMDSYYRSDSDANKAAIRRLINLKG